MQFQTKIRSNNMGVFLVRFLNLQDNPDIFSNFFFLIS